MYRLEYKIYCNSFDKERFYLTCHATIFSNLNIQIIILFYKVLDFPQNIIKCS